MLVVQTAQNCLCVSPFICSHLSACLLIDELDCCINLRTRAADEDCSCVLYGWLIKVKLYMSTCLLLDFLKCRLHSWKSKKKKKSVCKRSYKLLLYYFYMIRKQFKGTCIRQKGVTGSHSHKDLSEEWDSERNFRLQYFRICFQTSLCTDNLSFMTWFYNTVIYWCDH